MLGEHIVDFLAPAQGLVVEVDGPYHARRLRADARRDDQLEVLVIVCCIWRRTSLCGRSRSPSKRSETRLGKLGAQAASLPTHAHVSFHTNKRARHGLTHYEAQDERLNYITRKAQRVAISVVRLPGDLGRLYSP